MTQPVVSVVMAVRNGAQFLRESIESILAQSFDDLEFVIIDDGSIDRTPHILRDYASADRRLRVYTQENRGLANSLNWGWRLARAELVARMDADDVAKPERIARQVEHLQLHPKIAVLGTACEFINRDGSRRVPMTLPSEDCEIKKTLPNGNCLAHPSVMIRKSALMEAGGYRSTFLYAEDYDLWLRIAERHRLANLVDPLLSYRLHGGQTSLRHVRQQAISALAARLAAQRRRQFGKDPFDEAQPVSEQLLYKLGVAPESLDRAIRQSVADMSEIALQLGETEICKRLQNSNNFVGGRWRRAKLHFGGGRLRQGLQCLVRGGLSDV
jgi:glycosyltransferase involved in cell wall biosynthesis